MDRWLASRLATVTAEVTEELESYQVTRAYRALGEFVDELSNWYVRRSRARFWGNGDAADARAAFRTLHDALRTVAALSAPVTPFVSDWLHVALTGGSVHLAPFPKAGARDVALEEEMDAARRLVSLGRAAREEVGIRVRQPLRTLHAVVPGGGLREEVLEVVRDELNVKEVAFLSSSAGLVTLTPRPNYRVLGPRFGKSTNDAAKALRALPETELRRFQAGEEVTFELAGERYPVLEGELDLLEEAQGELVVKSEQGYTAALDPTLDAGLREEGLARELVNRIQRLRKDSGLEITDRIALGVFGPEEVRGAADAWREFIAGETLAVEVTVSESGGPDGWQAHREVDLDGIPAQVALRRAAG
jgi:isoleucyl-tRNA synthetase